MKRRLHIQTKNLSGGWSTVASFWDQVEAAGAFRDVFRGYSDGVRLVVESADGLRVLQGKGDTRG